MPVRALALLQLAAVPLQAPLEEAMVLQVARVATAFVLPTMRRRLLQRAARALLELQAVVLALAAAASASEPALAAAQT